MDEERAYLVVKDLNGVESRITIEGQRVSIGRFQEHNDIALQPDPQHLVTRVNHCTVERIDGVWWVVDQGSVNKTFVRREGVTEVVNGKALLGDQDTILVLGRLPEAGAPQYWEFIFHDPQGTQAADVVSELAFLEYDWLQARLLLFDGRTRTEIQGLRPQEHKLVRYIDQRNRSSGFVPVLCTYDELIDAIWEDDAYGRTEGDINRLVWELRKKIEFDPKDPQFVQTVRGLGVRLITKG